MRVRTGYIANIIKSSVCVPIRLLVCAVSASLISLYAICNVHDSDVDYE